LSASWPIPLFGVVVDGAVVLVRLGVVTPPAAWREVVRIIVPTLLVYVVLLDIVGRTATTGTPGHNSWSSQHRLQSVTVSPIPNS